MLYPRGDVYQGHSLETIGPLKDRDLVIRLMNISLPHLNTASTGLHSNNSDLELKIFKEQTLR